MRVELVATKAQAGHATLTKTATVEFDKVEMKLDEVSDLLNSMVDLGKRESSIAAVPQKVA